MLWEKLVTDGHVRAARIRKNGLDALLVAGLALAIGSYGIYTLLNASPISNDLSNSAQKIVNDRKTEVSQTLGAVALPVIDAADLKDVCKASDVPAFVSAVLAALKGSGQVQGNDQIVALDANQFWHKGPPVTKVGYIDRGNVKAFEALVDTTPNLPLGDKHTIKRWIGLFKKVSVGKDQTVWDWASVTGKDLYAPYSGPTIDPDNALLTLQTLQAER